MKFKIKKETLYNYLNKVAHIVNSKSPIESLNGIYFNLQEDLVLIGSDMDISMKAIIKKDIEIISTGSIILPKFIIEIIRKIDGEEISFELLENNKMQIKSKKSIFNINALDVEQFPNIDFHLEGEHISLTAGIFKDIINETVFASSKEEIRPVLTGVNFSTKDNILTCIATDSYRLAKKEINIANNEDFNIIIPAKFFYEINKLIKEEKDIKIFINQQRIIVSLDDVIIQSRLINGSYPDIANLIPNDFQTIIKINKDVILAAIDRANVLSLNSPSFTVTLKKDENLILSSNSNELGSIKEEINFLDYSGNDLNVSFNAKFASEAIKSFKSDTLLFKFNNSMDPFVIYNEDDLTIVQLILPIKTH